MPTNGVPVNQRRLHPVLTAMALLAAAPAWAMPLVPAGAAAAAVTQAAAAAGASTPGSRTFHAAGSVFVLVNGVMASARIAPVAVPAPGFVYER